MMPFMAMTGSKVADRRVVVLDGFAERGCCPDGGPAFTDVILWAQLNASPAVSDSVLVEQKRSNFAQQDALITEHHAQGVRSEVLLNFSADLAGRAVGAFKAAEQTSLELQELTNVNQSLHLS
jgi:hypothetical protein